MNPIIIHHAIMLSSSAWCPSSSNYHEIWIMWCDRAQKHTHTKPMAMAQRSQMRESVLLSVPGERGLGENLMKCIFTSGERTGRTTGLTLDKATRVLPNMIRGMSWGNGGQPTLSYTLPTHRFSTHFVLLSRNAGRWGRGRTKSKFTNIPERGVSRGHPRS